MEIPKNAIENTCFHSWLRPDGIVCTKVKHGSEVKLAHAVENTATVTKILEGITAPLLIDSRGIKSMEQEARNHFTTKNRKTHTTAFAILIESPLSKVIGNFFIGINKPAVPTKLFVDEKEAIKWLNGYL